MSGKLALTLLNCLVGPPLILGGLALAVRVAGQDALAGLTLVAVVLVLPVLVLTRITWAAGYAAGRRDRDLAPPSAG